MVASRRPSLSIDIDKDLGDTSPKSKTKSFDGNEILENPSSFGHTGINGHFDEKGKFIPHGNVQDQFKKLGPPPPLPPIPKEPSTDQSVASSVARKKSMSQIKTNLLRPALTSHYGVTIGIPAVLRPILSGSMRNGQEQLNLSCSEAVLPGSNLTTMEINDNFTGVTERHAYRRVFDDRVNLTFYVNAENYLPIRFFEAWKSYVMNEGQTAANYNPKNKNYSYRVNYPDGDKGYTATGLTITKFERDYRGSLTYEFIKSYPISVSAMPVSYDTSGLLKCTVSMTYLRYIVAQTGQFSMSQEPEKATSSENPNSTVNGVGPVIDGDEYANSLKTTSGIGPVIDGGTYSKNIENDRKVSGVGPIINGNAYANNLKGN